MFHEIVSPRFVYGTDEHSPSAQRDRARNDGKDVRHHQGTQKARRFLSLVVFAPYALGGVLAAVDGGTNYILAKSSVFFC